MDICIKNPMDECTHECSDCPQRYIPEQDEDYIRDIKREDKYYD